MNDEGRILTCVYCGMEYPQDTPAWGSDVLTEHIKVCEKHPMRKLEAENKRLRDAFIWITSLSNNPSISASTWKDRVESRVFDTLIALKQTTDNILHPEPLGDEFQKVLNEVPYEEEG